MREVIESFAGEYHFLSNFYEAPITLPDGLVAKTVEHAFQAYKSRWSEEYMMGLAMPSGKSSCKPRLSGSWGSWGG